MKSLIPITVALVFAGLSRASDAPPKRSTANGRGVTFVKHSESGEWKTWSDGRLSVRLPHDWTVNIDVGPADGSVTDARASLSHKDEWTYHVKSADGTADAFSILVRRGGPEFIGCFCAPRSVYEYTKADGFKIWALTLPGLNARMFKVASRTLRVDIHGELPSNNADQIRYMIESVRPVEPEIKKAQRAK